jgi:hypothetical protein
MKIGDLTKSIHERKNRTGDATKKQSTSYMYVKHDRKCKMRFGIGDSKRDTRVCNSMKRQSCIYENTVKKDMTQRVYVSNPCNLENINFK